MKNFLYKFFLFFLILGILSFTPLFTSTAYAATLFSDDFNRPDATTLGPNWTEFYGSALRGISSNRAYITTSFGGNWGLFKAVGLNAQDQVVQATYVHQYGNSTILARLQDINNRIVVDYYQTSGLQVY
jgi:hypothetical protein